MKSYALLFPGQGSQYVGMGQSFLKSQAYATILAEAEDSLSLPLKSLMFEGPIDKLTETAIAQPAILLHSIICYYHLIENHQLQISSAVGHSLGEYSALVAAGVLSLKDGLKAVHTRGLFMQEAVPKGHGKMAAVLGMDANTIVSALKEFAGSDYAAVANFNGPEQTVIAGTVTGVLKASDKLKSMGAKRVIELSVSAPFHCALMAPVAEKFSEVLSNITFNDAKFPIVTNVGAVAETKAEVLRNLLLLQIANPVRFTDCINFIKNHVSYDGYIELGPKTVLCGLVKKIDSKPLNNLDDLEDLQKFTN